jgi:hypothetical protein
MHINNVLNQSEIEAIKKALTECSDIEEQSEYGRYMYHGLVWTNDNTFKSTLLHKASELSGRDDWLFVGAACATYTAEAGEPNLPPHFDGDNTDLIMTYQIESNKQWGVGVDTHVYTLEDNDAVAFHPNENIHWRPHADFQDGEYVTVMFARFALPVGTNYAHKRFDVNHPIFDEVKAYRDSL